MGEASSHGTSKPVTVLLSVHAVICAHFGSFRAFDFCVAKESLVSETCFSDTDGKFVKIPSVLFLSDALKLLEKSLNNPLNVAIYN